MFCEIYVDLLFVRQTFHLFSFFISVTCIHPFRLKCRKYSVRGADLVTFFSSSGVTIRSAGPEGSTHGPRREALGISSAQVGSGTGRRGGGRERSRAAASAAAPDDVAGLAGGRAVRGIRVPALAPNAARARCAAQRDPHVTLLSNNNGPFAFFARPLHPATPSRGHQTARGNGVARLGSPCLRNVLQYRADRRGFRTPRGRVPLIIDLSVTHVRKNAYAMRVRNAGRHVLKMLSRIFAARLSHENQTLSAESGFPSTKRQHMFHG